MIIGITGNICSGKTFTADVIGNHLSKNGITVIKYSMADPVKRIAHRLYNINKSNMGLEVKIPRKEDVIKSIISCTRNSFYANDVIDFLESKEYEKFIQECKISKKNNPILTRKALQYIGTDMGRAIKKDIWVKAANEFEMWVPDPDSICIVIDDIRFLNEAKWVKTKGGIIIKSLITPEEILERYKSNITLDDINRMLEHGSEREICDIVPDYTLSQYKSIKGKESEIIDLIKSEKIVSQILD